MKRKPLVYVMLGLLICSSLWADELVLQDTIILKSGSQLTGKIITPRTKKNGREFIVFKTNSGGTLKLDTRRLIKRVHEVVPQYKERLSRMDDNSPEQHWEMYKWCKDQDSGSFKREMEYHLSRIVALDRTDDRAIDLLGYERFDGQLLPREHKFSEHGYVKVTGGWIPKQHVNIMADDRRAEAWMAQKRGALRKWQRELGKATRQELQQWLNSIVDESMVGEIFGRAMKETDAEVRLLYINSLGNVPSRPAQSALIFFVIKDDVLAIREQSIALLLRPDYDLAYGAARAAGPEFLHSKHNIHVLRAANLLREFNQINVVNQLAEALVTTHEFATGTEPGRTTIGRQSGGNNANSFQFGGGPKSVKVKMQNREVLDALRVITGQSLGPDERAWKAWYTGQHTIEQIDLRSMD